MTRQSYRLQINYLHFQGHAKDNSVSNVSTKMLYKKHLIVLVFTYTVMVLIGYVFRLILCMFCISRHEELVIKCSVSFELLLICIQESFILHLTFTKEIKTQVDSRVLWKSWLYIYFSTLTFILSPCWHEFFHWLFLCEIF